MYYHGDKLEYQDINSFKYSINPHEKINIKIPFQFRGSKEETVWIEFCEDLTNLLVKEEWITALKTKVKDPMNIGRLRIRGSAKSKDVFYYENGILERK